jgi:hypothetical protein
MRVFSTAYDSATITSIALKLRLFSFILIGETEKSRGHEPECLLFPLEEVKMFTAPRKRLIVLLDNNYFMYRK